MRLLGWCSFFVLILGVCPSVLHAQDNELLKERVAALVQRLDDADEGLRLAARMELERLGEEALSYLPARSESESVAAAVCQVRNGILTAPELEAIDSRMRQAQFELHFLSVRLKNGSSLDWALREQRVRHRILFDQAEARALRQGILEAAPRIQCRLQVRFDRYTINRISPSLAECASAEWTQVAQMLSEVSGVTIEVDPELAHQNVSLPLAEINQSLEDLLGQLTRSSEARFQVSERGVRISR